MQSLIPSRRVWLLGGLRVEDNHGRLSLPRGSVQSLFAYLLLHAQTSHSREQIAYLLWPDTPPDRLRRQLTNLLYRFQKSLGKDWLNINGELISLQRDRIWVDVWEFERLVRSNDRTDLNEAITLYAGDLAPEIYADWILPYRVHLRERFRTLLSQLAEESEKQIDLTTSVSYYQQLIRFDPLNETAVRGLMRIYGRLGKPQTAVTYYDQLSQALDTELNTTPLPETEALYKSIQVQNQSQPGDHSFPFVGRAQERRRLLSLLDQDQDGSGGLALVLGEAGIGKTRLLTEIAHAAQWRGWQTSWGHAEAFTLPPTFAPLNEALQSICPSVRLQQLIHLISLYRLANVTPLLPDLATTLNISLPDPQRSQLVPALSHLLYHLGQIAPQLILLDDMQWADPDLWVMLDELQPLLARSAVFLILNGRTPDLRAQPAIWQTITKWDQQNIPVLHLTGLSRTDLQTLAGNQHDQTEIDQLMQASGGNPLLALTLLEDNNLQAPASLLTLLRRRLQHLSAPAQLALQAAAVIGRTFDYLLWQQVVTAVTAADLPLLAGELEQANIIHLNDNTYQFAHDTLHACVYNDIPAERYRDLHHRVLIALQKTDSHDPYRLLYYAQQAKDQKAIGVYALHAGEQALASQAYLHALDYFTQALDHLSAQNDFERFRAIRGQIKASAIVGDSDLQAKMSGALLTLADQLANAKLQAEAAYLRTDFLWQSGQQEAAYVQALTGLEIAQQSGDVANQAALLISLSRIAHHRGDYDQAIVWVQTAHELFQQLQDRFGAADSLDKLANLTYQSGQYQRAAKLHQQAADVFQTLGNPLKEARALNGLGLAVRALGDYTQARQIHEQALRLGRELEDSELQWVQLVNLGNIAHELGNSDTAVAQYEHAIHIIRQIKNPYALALTSLNLGEICLAQGELTLAQQHYSEALALNRERGYQRGVALAQYGLGLTWLEAGRHSKAQKSLKAAQAIWQELNQPLKLMETEAALAQAYLVTGALDQAQAHGLAALALLDDTQDQTMGWRWVHYTAYLVFADTPEKARYHLRQAATAVQTQAHLLPSERQQTFLQKVPLNQKIMTAVTEQSQQRQVQLVRSNVPLGRKLNEDDYHSITWTIYSPLDDAVSNPVQRRQAILKRLLNEAAAQNAAPTDDDLAAILGVSRRTVERDMAVLKDEGLILPTRRRK